MISVEEALRRILDTLQPVAQETVSLSAAAGRVLAEDLTSRRTHPPADVSAMDGYAVKAADLANIPATLTQVGEAPAGGAYDKPVKPGETVRIFTGGTVPEGADTVVLQEDTSADGNRITVLEAPAVGRHIRHGGLDLQDGAVALRRGRKLTPRDISLVAAMNVPWVPVYRRPRVALLANGNELVQPGDPVGENQIISSNSLGLAALVEQCGGVALDLGIARDDIDDLQARAAGGRDADILVTIGGASVGDHDLVQKALKPIGLDVDFWKIAMRPGKPLMFGKLGKTMVIGLPGNPVSAFVCALLYLKPAICKLQGKAPVDETLLMPLAGAIKANGSRQDYMRAEFVDSTDGERRIQPFDLQDSSMLSILAGADGLVIREPNAPAAEEGELVNVLPL